jgi:ABC-type multidrug transport system fused ATPase/permease subunit
VITREKLAALFVPRPEGEHAVVAAAPAVPIRELARCFWPQLRPFRGWLAVGALLVAVVPAAEAAEVWLFKLVVDNVLVPADLGALPPYLLAIVVLTVLTGTLGFADDLLSAWVGERFLVGVRTRLYQHLQHGSPDALDRRRLGDVLARLTSDVQAIESFLLGGVAETVSALARILLFSGALFLLSWDLALVSLVVAPLFWLTAQRFSLRVRHASREKRRRSGSLGAVAEEGLSSLGLVQSLNREQTELDRFRRESEGIVAAELAATRLRALFAPVTDLLELIGGLLVLGWGTWAMSEGRLTLGGLLAFLAYLGLLYRPVRDLGQLSTTVFAAAAAGERVLELLAEQPAVTERPGASSLGRAAGRVELEDVTFRYSGRSRPALDRVSLRVEPGETLALVGQSGAGKSTVAKLLLRFHDPDRGTVRLDGHDLRDLRLDSLRENVAWLPQETVLFDGTIAENVAYGRQGASSADVRAACRAAGLDRVAETLPDGLETRIGQKGRRLSGGQRQRIGIARAILRDAPVLVLDEPTTGLDTASVRALLDPLRRLARERATIVISHDPLLLACLVDRVAVLDAGSVVERGAAADLLVRRDASGHAVAEPLAT